MFTELTPAETGIEFTNEYLDPQMWNNRHQEFSLGASGSGITIGDYDNDGRPDVFIVNKTGRSRLFKNLGSWKFEDVTEQSGLGPPAPGLLESVSSWFGSDQETESVEIWKQGAAFADVNNDGWLDLYLCRTAAPNELYMNQGDGTFLEAENAAGLALASASGMAAFCDFDRDGWLDAYVQTNMLDSSKSPSGQRDRLYRNNGDGTFSDITDQAGISGQTLGHSATWWDYNEDGWPDLYVANDFAKPDQLFRNDSSKGSPSFTDVIDSVVPRQPFSAMGADLGDVNNDGHVDLFVADMAPSTHEAEQRGMAVTRYAMRHKSPDTDDTPQYMFNALYLNTGTGKMLEGAWMHGLAHTDWTWSPRFEDLDNDGFLDLYITNGMTREYQNADLRQKVFRATSVQTRMSIIKSSPTLAESNLAYRNLNGRGFTRVEKDWGLAQVGVSFGSAFADFDNDGDLDLIYSNFNAPPTILRNDCTSGHRAIFELRGTSSNRYGIGATIEIETDSGKQVRQLVLARGYLSSSEPIAHFGLGKNQTINRATIRWPNGRVQTFAHLPSNKRFVVTEPNSPIQAEKTPPKTPPLFIKRGKAAGLTFESQIFPPAKAASQALATFSFARRTPTLAAGNLDSDKRPDLVIGSTGVDPAMLLFADAHGTFHSANNVNLPTDGLPNGPILIDDFNADGYNDLLLTTADPRPQSTEPHYPRLFLSNGDRAFQQAPKNSIPAAPPFAGSASSADFNRDGSIDVFIGSRAIPGDYPQVGRSVLFENHNGQFEDVSEALLPNAGDIGLVTDSLWSDVDTDGWPDLLISTEWGQVKYYRNLNGTGFEDQTEEVGFASAGTGLWSCLAVGDFNGDKRPDFIAGNIGLNTRYHATPDSPAVLYYGNFGGRPPAQLIEAHYENERLVPWRSRKELTDAIPSLARKFPSTNAYAAASLEEIISPLNLAKAKRLQATQLQSGIFLSNENGIYHFQTLPWIAQISPLQGIAVADFDGDDQLDLAVTQNLYDVDATTGRFDGGLGQLLLGDGKGEFQAVPPAESGLLIPGDGKSIVAVDFDGDGKPDIVATRAGSSPLAFLNQSAKEPND